MAKRFESYYQYFLENETPFDASPKKKLNTTMTYFKGEIYSIFFLLLSSPKLFIKAIVYNLPPWLNFMEKDMTFSIKTFLFFFTYASFWPTFPNYSTLAKI